jgi:hypothetical protein
MIADAVLYAAGRATGHAAEKVTRTLVWFALAAFMFTVAALSCVFGLFWYLEPRTGAVYAALVLALSGFMLALLFASVPSLMTVIETAAVKHKTDQMTPAAVIQLEAREVVDYFGTAKVLISAFLLGLGAARSFKGR